MDECPVESWIDELKNTAQSIPEEDVKDMAEVFHALSDPLRIKILKLLAVMGELCGCEIQVAFNLKQPAISYHLNLLRKAGVLNAEKRGTWMYYRIGKPEVLSLLAIADKIKKEA